MFDLRRRNFIALLGGAAAAWPLAARAQQARMKVVGILRAVPPDMYPHLLVAFRQALNETGFVEGRNVAIEHRWTAGRYEEPRPPIGTGDGRTSVNFSRRPSRGEGRACLERARRIRVA